MDGFDMDESAELRPMAASVADRGAGGDPAAPAGCPLPDPQFGDDVPALERLSNTQGPSSHPEGGESESLPEGMRGIASVDWWDSAGRVEWVEQDTPAREDLERAFTMARELKVDQPLVLAGQSLLLKPNGMGSGNQPRLPFRLELKSGITVGLAFRPSEKRNVYNFHLKIPGAACLLWGWREVRQQVAAILDALGGQLVDEWVRRIDLCFDVQGLDLRQELLPAFVEERFVTSAHQWNPWGGRDGATGFSVGRGGRVVLNVYDKRLEATRRQKPDYLAGMIQRRWGGVIPHAATRIEFQVRKQWLDQYRLTSADLVESNLASIFAILTSEEGRSYFRMTADRVDRENKHQSRAATLPLWSALMADMQRQLGISGERLPPLERGGMDLKRDYGILRGILAKVAAIKGEACLCLDDAVDVLRRLDSHCGGSPEAWERIWSDKARGFGTLDAVMTFP